MTIKTPVKTLIEQNNRAKNGTDSARTYSADISRERQKQTGEIFTPKYLVDEMITRLGEDALEVNYTIFEPASGDGNFIARLIERKVIKEIAKQGKISGVVFKHIVASIYGCEYMLDNVNTIKQRIWDLANRVKGFKGGATYNPATPLGKIIEKNIVYCNTLDPWDTSENRCYPEWLKKAILAGDNGEAKMAELKKKSKFYKKQLTV